MMICKPWESELKEALEKLSIDFGDLAIREISGSFANQAATIAGYLRVISYCTETGGKDLDQLIEDIFVDIFNEIFKIYPDPLDNTDEEFYNFHKTVDPNFEENFYVEYPRIVNSIKVSTKAISMLTRIPGENNSQSSKDPHMEYAEFIIETVINETAFMKNVIDLYRNS